MEIILGLWHEALRVEKLVELVQRVQPNLVDQANKDADEVVRQLLVSSRLLRDLYDLIPIYGLLFQHVLPHLDVVLPSLQRTLMDMHKGIADNRLGVQDMWAVIFLQLTVQADMLLQKRLELYNDFLGQIIQMLRSPTIFSTQTTEGLRTKIMDLRRRQSIPTPRALIASASGDLVPVVQPQKFSEKPHWAEKIFTSPTPTTTKLANQRLSRCFAQSAPENQLGIIPGSRILFKLPFDNNHFSVSGYIHPSGQESARLMCRWIDIDNMPARSSYGVHELCIARRGPSLRLRRWAEHTTSAEPWAALFFRNWERLVIFHCAFVAMKVRCPLTLDICPDEYSVGSERKLFQGQIMDDGFYHGITVYRDKDSDGIRLHAYVWEGELQRCPVWTAFVTQYYGDSTWAKRVSNHRVRLSALRPFVFCQDYHWRRQLKNGEFELNFRHVEAAAAFCDLFSHGSDAGSKVLEPSPPPDA